MRTSRTAGAVLATLALVTLSGCGGGGSPEPEPTGPATITVTETVTVTVRPMEIEYPAPVAPSPTPSATPTSSLTGTVAPTGPTADPSSGPVQTTEVPGDLSWSDLGGGLESACDDRNGNLLYRSKDTGAITIQEDGCPTG